MRRFNLSDLNPKSRSWKKSNGGFFAVRTRYQDCWEEGPAPTFSSLHEAKEYCERLLKGPLGSCAMYYVVDKAGETVALLTVEGWRNQ